MTFFSVPNELGGHGKAAMLRTARLKRIGLRPGVADLVVMLPGGKVVFVEVKTKTGRQSENQKDFQEKCFDLGFAYHLVRSVEDVQNCLHQHL